MDIKIKKYKIDCLGKKIKKWTGTNKSILLLDKYKETKGMDWEAGGCLPLAIVLNYIIPKENNIYGIIQRNNKTIHHVVVRYGDKFFDRCGGRKKHVVIKYWKDMLFGQDIDLVPISDKQLQEIKNSWGTTPHNLIRELKEVLASLK